MKSIFDLFDFKEVFKTYKRISWDDTKAGMEVYLAGSKDGKATSSGGFTILSRKHRALKNIRKQSFIHYPEELLIKKEQDNGKGF
jgi:hypothetical protein